MIDKQEAMRLVIDLINSNMNLEKDNPCVIVDEHTIEKDMVGYFFTNLRNSSKQKTLIIGC